MNLLIQSVVDKRRQATGLSSNVATEGKEREKVAPVRSCLLRQL